MTTNYSDFQKWKPNKLCLTKVGEAPISLVEKHFPFSRKDLPRFNYLRVTIKGPVLVESEDSQLTARALYQLPFSQRTHSWKNPILDIQYS